MTGAADTPILRQYREAKAGHPDGILLFRLGDFFEIFFEDAVVAAPVMGVTLTSRPMGKNNRSPMCGVPAHAWPTYVGKLLRAGFKVVLCDQVEAAHESKGIVRREVTRVLTPGTVLEEDYLEAGTSNYLVSWVARGGQAGLAACDLSAGELLLCQLPESDLPNELRRLNPVEVLTPPAIDDRRFDLERGRHRLQDVLGIGYLNSIGADAAPLAVAAAGVVVEYLLANQVTLAPGLLRVRTYSVDAVMSLDSATAANLELQSLVKLVDRTVTAAGLRRLRSWIESPLREAESIELRLAAVDELVGNREFEEKLADALKPVGDLERMLARAAQGLAPPRELVALRRSLEALPALKGLAEDGRSLELRALAGRIEALADLAGSLRAALVDDPPATIREGGVIRPGFDPDLDAIHSASASSRQWINELEGRERERTGIRTLKAGYNRVFGYYLEVGHGQSAMVPADYIRKQTLAGAERYLTPELKEHEAIVLNAQHHAVTREGELLRTLQKLVTDAAASILSSAAASAELDALRSLASVARALAWTRPVISTGLELRLEGCRHPLVEASLPPATFVANDLDLDPDRAQIVILTGPNMAGKSTYLRQIALTVLLAQVGSFVPCREATIGLTDRIFTRIGAHDDLAAGMSTFMVEMTETASILNHATATSLVILDEVGRGTSTYDGVSIAQAVVEYLHESPRLRCRTLFATHYHELTALAETLPRVANYRMEVVEEGEEIRFLHQIVEGGADRSYGIHVAALAGLPAQLVARARQIMAELERERPLEPPEHQLKLDLPPGPNPIKDELSRIEVDHLTPLEALQKLYELRSRAQRS